MGKTENFRRLPRERPAIVVPCWKGLSRDVLFQVLPCRHSVAAGAVCGHCGLAPPKQTAGLHSWGHTGVQSLRRLGSGHQDHTPGKPGGALKFGVNKRFRVLKMPEQGCLPRKASGKKYSHLERYAMSAADGWELGPSPHHSSELQDAVCILKGWVWFGPKFPCYLPVFPYLNRMVMLPLYIGRIVTLTGQQMSSVRKV